MEQFCVATEESDWMKRATPPASDDQSLVVSIAAGGREALAELYARYQQSLYSYLLQLTPDHGLAEEILQDTLVAVWKSARSFEGRSTVLTWLIGIARRQAHNTLRQHRLPLADEAELADMISSEPEPEAFALNSVARDELVVAFRQLPALQREVLALVLVHERSYEETAAILGVPVGTVKSRLSNAKRMVRALLTTKEEAES
jgi:RNA polymerase sigma factor (sigma-70 family)